MRAVRDRRLRIAADSHAPLCGWRKPRGSPSWGKEMAGEVVAAGDGVSRCAGDRLFGAATGMRAPTPVSYVSGKAVLAPRMSAGLGYGRSRRHPGGRHPDAPFPARGSISRGRSVFDQQGGRRHPAPLAVLGARTLALPAVAAVDSGERQRHAALLGTAHVIDYTRRGFHQERPALW